MDIKPDPTVDYHGSWARRTDSIADQSAPAISGEADRSLCATHAHREQHADGIDFFHMDALSSAVAMKVDCDLQLTLMASSLYRLLASNIGNGYQTARSRTSSGLH